MGGEVSRAAAVPAVKVTEPDGETADDAATGRTDAARPAAPAGPEVEQAPGAEPEVAGDVAETGDGSTAAGDGSRADEEAPHEEAPDEKASDEEAPDGQPSDDTTGSGLPARPEGRRDLRTAMFPHVGRWSRGYDVAEVDDFFAAARRAYEGPLDETLSGGDVRGAAFDLVRGGYDPGAVDAALDRLEGAFVRRQRAAFVIDHSQQEWMSAVAERATTLYSRLVRPAGQRFAPPSSGSGYAAADVDELLDRLVSYFDHGAALTAAEVRAGSFGSARGARAYAEGPVDAFLDRVVEILLAVE